jgi:hypothetical protein
MFVQFWIQEHTFHSYEHIRTSKLILLVILLQLIFQTTAFLWTNILSHFLLNYLLTWGTRGSVVGWGTVLQAGRSRVRFRMRSLDFFNLPNPFSSTMTLGSAQALTEMSTRIFLEGKRRPARKADNLTAIREPIVSKMSEPWCLTILWASTASYLLPLLSSVIRSLSVSLFK